MWYAQVDPAILRLYWGKFDSDDPCAAAQANMYKIMRVKAGEKDAGEELETETRKVKWDEVCCVMGELERRYGWGKVDGREVYTKDEDPSHKSNVMGELGRFFFWVRGVVG